MSRDRLHSYEPEDNLDSIIGCTVTWSFSSDPPVSAADAEAVRQAQMLPRRWAMQEMHPRKIFVEEARKCTLTYSAGEGDDTVRRKLTALPTRREKDRVSTVLVAGTTKARHQAKPVQIAWVEVDAKMGAVEWGFHDLDRVPGEPDDRYLASWADQQLPAGVYHEDGRRAAHAARRIAARVTKFSGCLDVMRYREAAYRVLTMVRALPVTAGTWFVLNDTAQGDENPVLVAQLLKRYLETVQPRNRIYLVPVYPSADAVERASEDARTALLARIAEVSEKLDSLAKIMPDNEEHWIARFNAIEAEAEMYERVLDLQADTFRGRLDAAKQLMTAKRKLADASLARTEILRPEKMREAERRKYQRRKEMRAAGEAANWPLVEIPRPRRGVAEALTGVARARVRRALLACPEGTDKLARVEQVGEGRQGAWTAQVLEADGETGVTGATLRGARKREVECLVMEHLVGAPPAESDIG